MGDAKEMCDVGLEKESIEEQKKLQIAIDKMKSYCKSIKYSWIHVAYCILLPNYSGEI